MSPAIYHRRKWKWNTFLHSGWVSINAPHNQTPQINQQKDNSFSSGSSNYNITSSTYSKENNTHFWRKIGGNNNSSIPKDTKMAHHQSFKEYWQKEGTNFVLHVLGEYTIKGHECFTLIKITATTSKEKRKRKTSKDKWKKRSNIYRKYTMLSALHMLPYLTFLIIMRRV